MQPPPARPKVTVGDSCLHGHLISGDNVKNIVYRGKEAIRCRKCIADQQRRYHQDPIRMAENRIREAKRRANPAAHAKRLLQESRARLRKKAIEEDTLALKDDKRPTAPWNLLRLPEDKQPYFDALTAAFDASTYRAKCFDNPGPYQDYAAEDTPTRSEAEALCKGCPFKVECRQYGENVREPGVWGGLVVIGSKSVYG